MRASNRPSRGVRPRRSALLGGAAVVAFTLACAGAQPPTSLMSQAELAVRNAQQATAPQHAPLELHQAEEKLREAQQAMAKESHVEARRLAEEALLQAQVAEERARSEVARTRAQDLQESIATLRSETERTTRARTRTLELYRGESDESSGSEGMQR